MSFMVVALTSLIFKQHKDNSFLFCRIQMFLFIITLCLPSWNDLRWLSTRQLLESCNRYGQIFLPMIGSEKQVIYHASLGRMTENFFKVKDSKFHLVSGGSFWDSFMYWCPPHSQDIEVPRPRETGRRN